MQITKTTKDGMLNPADVPKPTDEELQSEYDYFLAEQLTRKLLDKGLITLDGFTRIMAKNRETFSPFLARIIPE